MAGALKKLLLRLILENAIVFEEKAYRFYEEAKKDAKKDETKEVLHNLMAEELKHRLRLEEAQRQADLNACCNAEPELDTTVKAMTESWPQITPESDSTEVLKAAYKKEKQARDFYLAMGKRFPKTFAGNVFNSLAKEEAKHADWIASKME